MKVIDHTQIVKDYKGKWVVLDKTYRKVQGEGKTWAKEIKQYRAKGFTDTPSVFKVPTKLTPYVGSSLK